MITAVTVAIPENRSEIAYFLCSACTVHSAPPQIQKAHGVGWRTRAGMPPLVLQSAVLHQGQLQSQDRAHANCRGAVRSRPSDGCSPSTVPLSGGRRNPGNQPNPAHPNGLAVGRELQHVTVPRRGADFRDPDLLAAMLPVSECPVLLYDS